MGFKEARIRKKLTQQQVADFIGVSRQTVICWETGRKKPYGTHLIKTAQLLGVTPEELMKDEPD